MAFLLGFLAVCSACLLSASASVPVGFADESDSGSEIGTEEAEVLLYNNFYRNDGRRRFCVELESGRRL